MIIKELITESPLAKFGRKIRNSPREIICNRNIILSTMLYASCAIPVTWDQGSASVVPSLPGFQKHFNLSSGADAGQIRNFISFVYIGYAVGSAISFFINDRIGRLWSFRLYLLVWAIGQMIAISTPNVRGLYVARFVTGLGIGPLTVTGPMSIVEIAPTEIRGLLASWFVVAMGIAHFTSIFCAYGIFLHMATSRLQYQIVWFAPCIFMGILIIGSFFVCESPRWLLIAERHEEAVISLSKLRGLPRDHPRVQQELNDIELSILPHGNLTEHPSFFEIVKETFTVPSNLRRVQQTLVSYALAQLSGANSITSYFVPIMSIISPGEGASRNIFLSGMYGFSKFFFSLIAAFFFIDAFGRRQSLFVGTFLQMISDIYIGVYVKYQESASHSASEAAIAALFIHAFGYAVGLLTLPYVFGGELWPNRIRSFGGAMSQTFHWIFIYIMKFAFPSLLKQTGDWGAFIFFAAWCFVSFVYVYLMVPEVAGLSVEEIEDVFRGPWYDAHRRVRRQTVAQSIESGTVGSTHKQGGDETVVLDSKDQVQVGAYRTV